MNEMGKRRKKQSSHLKVGTSTQSVDVTADPRLWFVLAIVGIIAVLYSVYVIGTVPAVQSQPSPTALHPVATPWIPAEFTPIPVSSFVPDQPIAHTIGVFIAHYRTLTLQNSANPQAVKTVITQEINQLLVDVAAGQPTLTGLHTMHSGSGTFDFHRITVSLNEVLLPTGWAVSISEAAYKDTGVVLPTFQLAHVIASREETVLDFSGTPHSCTVYLLSLNDRMAPGTEQAEAIGNTVLVLSEQVWDSAGRILERLRAAASSAPPNNPFTPFDQRQFANLLVNGVDELSLHRQVAELVLADTLSHELQHIRDASLLKAGRSPGISGLGFFHVRIYAESRAVLRQIADGPIPYYALSNLLNAWPHLPDEYQEASSNVIRFLELGPSPVTVSEAKLRARAKVVLAGLDQNYTTILAHVQDPDPFESLYGRKPTPR